MVQMMSLNAFGLRKELTGGIETYKDQRMNAIAKEISYGKYDLVLLQEVWIESDYNTIKKAIPPNFHITSFENFNKFNETNFNCVRTGLFAGLCKNLFLLEYVCFPFN